MIWKGLVLFTGSESPVGNRFSELKAYLLIVCSVTFNAVYEGVTKRNSMLVP
jgi:hypothetical protein